MKNKICIKCNENKEISFFEKRKDTGKYRNSCKLCINKRKNSNLRQYQKQLKQYHLQYGVAEYKICSKCNKNLPYTEFYRSTKTKTGLRSSCKKCFKVYTSSVRERRNVTSREYYLNNPLVRLNKNVVGIIYSYLRNQGYNKKDRTQDILGCNRIQFYNWLNNKASNGLNYDKDAVNLDHVIPVSWAESEEELLMLNHYSNFQLLSPKENREKSNKPPRFCNLVRVLQNHPHKDELNVILKNKKVYEFHI